MIKIEEVTIPITAFGSSKEEHITFYVCELGFRFDSPDSVGLSSDCEKCKNRFICATQRP